MARGEEAVDDLVTLGRHEEGFERKVRRRDLLKETSPVNKNARAVEKAVQDGKGVAGAHCDMEVDLSGLVDELHGQRTTKSFNLIEEIRACFLSEILQGCIGEHTNNLTPNGGCRNNESEFPDIARGKLAGGGRVTSRIKVLGKRLNMNSIAKGKVDIGAW